MAKRKKKDAACELVAYRFYGVPSEQDAAQEDKTFGCCRYLEPDAGGDHNTLYAEIGHVLNNTPADYKDLDECFFLNEVDSLALANTALNLDAAFEQFVICFRQKKYPGSSFRYWSRILVICYPIFCAFLHFPHHKDTMPSSTMPRFLNSLVTFALSSNRSGNCS